MTEYFSVGGEMLSYLGFLSGFVLALIVVRSAIPAAERIGIVDRPSGHKQHSHPVPYVGGFGILAALLLYAGFAAGMASADQALYLSSLAISGTLMFVVGLADDRWQLSSRTRLVIEAMAVLIMVFGAGVVLTDLGGLLPGMTIALGLLAVPFTIFCITGVTNALNMIDGVDGLSGGVSLVSFLGLAVMAAVGGNSDGALFAIVMAGGVLGFLYFNFRFGRQRNARVYLGDNGSMLIGFLLGWLFVDLSQGDDAVMAPVTALFLFGLPLYDSVLAITRRLWMRRSPFKPDRSHLHHMLLDAGASVETTVWLLIAFHALMALVGLAGYYVGAPDALMFGLFMGGFVVYGYVMSRPWRFVPRIRQVMVRLGLPLEHGTGIFVGRFDRTMLPLVLSKVGSAVGNRARVRVFAEESPDTGREVLFVVADLGTWRGVRPAINHLRRSLSMTGAFEIRQFVERQHENDRRRDVVDADAQRRSGDRRGRIVVRELVEHRLDSPPRIGAVTKHPLAA